MLPIVSPHWRDTKHFSYNLYTCTNHFIHLLGSSIIQLIIVIINEIDEHKQDLQVRLGEAMLRLGREVRLNSDQKGHKFEPRVRLGIGGRA